MNIEQEIRNILDRNFTRGDNANALKELLVLYKVVGRSEQLCQSPSHHAMEIGLQDECSECGAKE